jgi:hypothetical protein
VSGRKPYAGHFGLNPDYVFNHLRALYQENPPNHPNHCLFRNIDAMMYPQRRSINDTQRPKTPLPLFNMWHETSFMESQWHVLQGIIIRYYERGTHNERDAKIFGKDNSQGFFVKYLRSGENVSDLNWRWDEISYKKLVPVRASYQNWDFLWIILDREYASRYCKAIYAPLEPKPGEALAFFTVAFTHVKTRESGQRVTTINTPREEKVICEDLIGVAWQTKAQWREEPNIYLGAIGMQKREKEKRGTKRKRVGG